MKKFLLMALVVLTSVTASAQNGLNSAASVQQHPKQQPARQLVKKENLQLRESKAMGNAQTSQQAQTAAARLQKAMKPLNLNKTLKMGRAAAPLTKNELKNMRPASNKASLKAQRRAGQVQDLYFGSGIDYSYDGVNTTTTEVSWEMYNGLATFEDGTEQPLFYNVVPTPEEFKSVEGYEEGAYYFYDIDDNGNIVIPAQNVVSYTGNDGGTYYVNIFAADERGNVLDDGAIKLTLAEDGSLKTANSTIFVLGVFSSVEVTNDNYLGYYQLILDVEYTMEGQQDPLPEEFSLREQFDAFGTNYSTKANETWTLYQGTMVTKTDKLQVFVNMIPSSKIMKDIAPNGVPVSYTQSGNVITVQPQKVGEWKSSTAGLLYIYIFSYTAADGSITMTVGDDGSLSLPAKEGIFYGAFYSDAFNPQLGDSYAGYVEFYQNVQYLKAGQIPVPVAEAEMDGVYLFAEISPSLYGYNASFVSLPCYADVTYRNFTDASTADTYSWSMNVLDTSTGEPASTITGTDRDFTFKTSSYDFFSPATLIASNQGQQSNPYTWGLAHADEDQVVYVQSSLFGPDEDDYTMPDGTNIMFTKASINCNSITLGRNYGTPDVNNQGDKITKLVFYQGKPGAPLYFEGINLLVWDLQNYDNIDLKCQIVKATRNEGGFIELGDVIAESITSADEVVAGAQENGWLLSQLNWSNFYTTDDWGMTEDVSYIMLDEEFAIVFDGWNSGNFSCMPLMEYETNNSGEPQTFFYITGDEEYSEDDLLAYTSDYAHAFVGFNYAIYGYMQAETADGSDDTNFEFDKEGGEARIHVHPMLWTGDEAEPTLLYLEKITVDGEELDDPEELDWVEVNLENEVYTAEEFGFDLVVKVAPVEAGSRKALKADATTREAELTFMQYGARLVISVKQTTGENGQDGIVETTVKTIPANAKTYNLAGQQTKRAKGIVLRDGKKYIVK